MWKSRMLGCRAQTSCCTNVKSTSVETEMLKGPYLLGSYVVGIIM